MKWSTMSTAEKVSVVITCIAALFVVVVKLSPTLLPIDPIPPAIAVFTMSEAVVYWKKKRTWAYLLIAAAVISMASFVLELMLLS